MHISMTSLHVAMREAPTSNWPNMQHHEFATILERESICVSCVPLTCTWICRILKQLAVEAFRHMQLGSWRAGLVRIDGRMNDQLACTWLAVGASHDFSLIFGISPFAPLLASLAAYV